MFDKSLGKAVAIGALAAVSFSGCMRRELDNLSTSYEASVPLQGITLVANQEYGTLSLDQIRFEQQGTYSVSVGHYVQSGKSRVFREVFESMYSPGPKGLTVSNLFSMDSPNRDLYMRVTSYSLNGSKEDSDQVRFEVAGMKSPPLAIPVRASR